MPLKKSGSKSARTANIKQLIKEGYKPKQAAAIGYSVQRKAAAKKGKRKKGK